MTNYEPAAPLGYRLGGAWETTAFIGRGPVGEVYECIGKDGTGTFAAKLLPEELLDSSETWSDYLAAVSAAASLQHEATVKHVAFGSDLQLACPFVVTERVALPSLAECIARSGPFSPSRWRGILTVLASVLDRAHAAGVVHGRLTPTNVFVSAVEPAQVKISDFGVAIACAARAGDAWAGGVRGWVGPESESSTAKPAPATDVYSLGLLTFFALTGRTLFRALDSDRIDAEQLRREVNEPLPSASALARKLGTEFDPAFDKWFSRTITPSPVARYSSTRLLGEAFDRLARRLETGPVNLAEPTPARKAAPAKPAREPVLGVPRIAASNPVVLKPAKPYAASSSATRARAPVHSGVALAVAASLDDPPTLRISVASLFDVTEEIRTPAPTPAAAPQADYTAPQADYTAPQPDHAAPQPPTSAEPPLPAQVATESTADAIAEVAAPEPAARHVGVESPAPALPIEPAAEPGSRPRFRISLKAGGLAAALGLVLFGVVIGKSISAWGADPETPPAAVASQTDVTKCAAPEPPPVARSEASVRASKPQSDPVALSPVVTAAPAMTAAPVVSAEPVATAAAPAVTAAPVTSAAPIASAAPVANAAPVVRKSAPAKAAPRRTRAPAPQKPCGTFINPCR